IMRAYLSVFPKCSPKSSPNFSESSNEVKASCKRRCRRILEPYPPDPDDKACQRRYGRCGGRSDRGRDPWRRGGQREEQVEVQGQVEIDQIQGQGSGDLGRAKGREYRGAEFAEPFWLDGWHGGWRAWAKVESG